MLEAIVAKFKSTPVAESVTPLVDRLAKKRADALVELARARAAHAIAALDVADAKDGSESALIAVRKTVDKAEVAYKDADAAFSAARARYRDALEAETAKELAERWNEAGHVAMGRIQALERLHECILDFAEAYGHFTALTDQLRAVLPENSRPDLIAVLDAGHVIGSVRIALKKAGIDWAHGAPPDAVRAAPPLVETFTAETQALIALRSV